MAGSRLNGGGHPSMCVSSTMRRSKNCVMSHRPSERPHAWRARHGTPNPGTYNPPDPCMTSKFSGSPAHSIGQSSTCRLDTELSVNEGNALKRTGGGVPGPGTYNHIENFGKVGSSGNRSVLESPRTTPRPAAWNAKHGTPNPGTYNPNDPDSTTKMSRSARAIFGVSSTGRMETDRCATSEGSSLVKISNMRGPGSYSHREYLGTARPGGKPLLDSPRISPRPVAWHAKHGTPNPGTYNPSDPDSSSKFRKSPRAPMAKMSTGRLAASKTVSEGNTLMTTGQNVPGPGTYASTETLVKSQVSSKALLSSPRSTPRPVAWSAKHAVPSPGTYNPNDPDVSKMARSPRPVIASTATGRLDKNVSISSEGNSLILSPPGSEHSETIGKLGSGGKPALASPRASSRPEAWRAKHGTPNPGTYNPNGPEMTAKMRSSTNFSFGSASTGRLPSARVRVTPGPGCYGGHYTQF